MGPRTSLPRLATAALAAALLAACFDEPPLPSSGLPVFTDAFTNGFTPNPFDTAVTTALKIDTTTAHTGGASIRLDVPASAGGYTGGAVLAATPQDLSSCNALLFWAKASRAATFDDLGYGLSFTGSSAYQSVVGGLPLTTEWTQHVIPIPDPSRLTAEDGMLWWVEVDPSGYTAWLDDVKFDRVDPALLALQPAVVADTMLLPVTASDRVALRLRYTDLDGVQRFLDSSTTAGSGPAPAFFSYTSSNPSVLAVDATGKMTALSVGTAAVTARLAGVAADGAVTVNVVATAPTAPAAAAATPPARAAADVVSLYTSGAVYANKTVDTWWASWSVGGGLTTPTIGGRVVKDYGAIKYAGVETMGTKLDVSAMTTMHVDLWTPDATTFTVKLVGFNGSTNTGEKAVSFGNASIKRWRWVSLDIPLSSFGGVDLTRVGQIVWVTDPASATATGTFFIDNVYFYR
jgi:hypothetical protein